ncbi:MAG: GntR family transcriptional regulator [Lachnospiraceae bacterium]|nr:GntR family transcriptional regulator [Lachnospiraceae bacterium]
MNIKIQSKSGVPIYEQIEAQIKESIIDGTLETGSPLPSIRSLASDLKISVITTKRAYEELEKEGMIYSVPGKGFFVDNPDVQYLEEKRTLGIEDEVGGLIGKAKNAGLTKDEFKDMIDILWEDVL